MTISKEVGRIMALTVLHKYADDDNIVSRDAGGSEEVTVTLTAENNFQHDVTFLWPGEADRASEILSSLAVQAYNELRWYRERSMESREDEAELDLRRMYTDGNLYELTQILQTARKEGADTEAALRALARFRDVMALEEKEMPQRAHEGAAQMQKLLTSLFIDFLEASSGAAIAEHAQRRTGADGQQDSGRPWTEGHAWWNKECLWNKESDFAMTAEQLEDAAALLESAAGDRSICSQKEINRALAVICREARRDNPEGLYQLGVLYAEGVYVPKNDLRAEQLFVRAGWLDSARAQAEVASMYGEEDGPHSAPHLAEAWKRKAEQSKRLEAGRLAERAEAVQMWEIVHARMTPET